MDFIECRMDSKEYVKDYKGLQKTSMDFIKDKWTLGNLDVLLRTLKSLLVLRMD
jgi:hypothetical protein